MLVVDDNATWREHETGLLTQWRFRPASAAGGAEALRSLREAAAAGDPFRLAVLDINMPGMNGLELAQQIQAEAALRETGLLILSRSMRPATLATCRLLGLRHWLDKPCTDSELLNAMLAALGGQPALPRPAADAAAPQSAAWSGPPLRVLLAEDQAINQEIALEILRRWGHTVVLARDGNEAAAAQAREPFDVVLMDVQMPDLDGFAATARIREREAAINHQPSTINVPRVPIIALTAHAMKSDREKCLAAGMDGYLSKPIERKALLAELARVCGARVAAKAPPPRRHSISRSCWTIWRGTARCGGRWRGNIRRTRPS